MEQAVKMRALKTELSQALARSSVGAQVEPFSVASTAERERRYMVLLYQGARDIIPTLPAAYN
jgi:hypothetical protein